MLLLLLLLSDDTKFKNPTQTPPDSREDSLSTYLRKLERDVVTDNGTLHKILLSGSTHGALYGLPKEHKSGRPFRPTISSVNTYNYNLASYLVRALQSISTNQFTGCQGLL